MPLRSLGMWVGQAQRATASGERIFQVMDEPVEIADRPGAVELPAGGGRLSFENVGFEYLDGRAVLQEIELEIEPGKTIALIGHTGSGKTTLTSLVPRFYDVTSGRVTARRRRRPRREARARCAARSASSPRIPSSSLRPSGRTSPSALRTSTTPRSSGSRPLAQAHEFIDKLPARLRHGDRRARHHALGRAAAARWRSHARLRSIRASSSSTTPRRRSMHRRRRGSASACARRCETARR